MIFFLLQLQALISFCVPDAGNAASNVIPAAPGAPAAPAAAARRSLQDREYFFFTPPVWLTG